MGGGADDAEVGGVGGVGEGLMGGFGHALDFEREDAEFTHYARDAIRDHAEVFTAKEHGAGFAQGGEFFESSGLPEFVLAAVEVVVVEIDKARAGIGVEVLPGLGLVEGVAWVEEGAIGAGDFDEKNLGGDVHEDTANVIGVRTGCVVQM